METLKFVIGGFGIILVSLLVMCVIASVSHYVDVAVENFLDKHPTIKKVNNVLNGILLVITTFIISYILGYSVLK